VAMSVCHAHLSTPQRTTQFEVQRLATVANELNFSCNLQLAAAAQFVVIAV